MKRIISFVIAFAALISCLALASCAENSQKGPDGDLDRPDDESRWLDDIPEEVTLEGKEVTFVGYQNQGAFETGLSGTHADENTGDSVVSALFESEKAIEERFGVDIWFIDASNTLSISIKGQLMAGDTDYDVLCGYGFFDISLAAEGYVLNLNDLSRWEADDIIDHEKPYWFTQYIDGITYRDNMCWLVGDISTLTLGCMYVTFVGAQLYERVCLETYGSIYDIVTSGGWNLDILAEMASLAYSDKNGNDVADLGDSFGWSTSWVDVVEGMTMGAGFEYSSKQADGSITLTINSQHNINVISKLYALKRASYSFVTPDDPDTMLDFKAGNILFTVNDLRLAEMYLREMETDYYILPTPKFDANQSEYRTAVHDEYPLFGISYASDEVYASAVVLEALCAEHSRVVRPKYYDEALKYKYSRDDESAEMIDIVRDSVYTDFVFAWNNSVNKVTHSIRDLPANPASLFRKNESSWNTALNNLLTSLST